jgi:hypothetical protein
MKHFLCMAAAVCLVGGACALSGADGMMARMHAPAQLRLRGGRYKGYERGGSSPGWPFYDEEGEELTHDDDGTEFAKDYVVEERNFTHADFGLPAGADVEAHVKKHVDLAVSAYNDGDPTVNLTPDSEFEQLQKDARPSPRG